MSRPDAAAPKKQCAGARPCVERAGMLDEEKPVPIHIRKGRSFWGKRIGMMTPGYRRTVITPQGRETLQVWLAREDGRWIARIVTLPNRMWVKPGGREAPKFYGASREEAEMAAASFIESERVARGVRAPGPAESGQGTLGRVAVAPRAGFAPPDVPSPPSHRLIHRLLLRFGLEHPDIPGVTANLSETGLFIITSQPRPIGSEVAIDPRFAYRPVFLGGEVVWISPERRSGISVGFGVKLLSRPEEYLEQLRTLTAPHIAPLS